MEKSKKTEVLRSGDVWCGFYVVYSVLSDPMEDFYQGENGELRQEADCELLSEDCHGEEGFYDSLAESLVDSLYFEVSKSSKEHLCWLGWWNQC